MSSDLITLDLQSPGPDTDLTLSDFIGARIALRLPPVPIPVHARLKLYIRISPLHSINKSLWCWHTEPPVDGWDAESAVRIDGERAIWEAAGRSPVSLELESRIDYKNDARYRIEAGLFDMRTETRLWGAHVDRFILDRLAGSEYLKVLDSKHLNPLSRSYIDNKNFNLLGVARGRRIATWIAESTDFENRLILDLGCATGGATCGYAFSGARVIGLEPDAVSIELSRLRAVGESADVRLVRGSGYSLPFRSGRLDGVIMADVFEHVPEPGLILNEIRRVLRPGGFFYISVPNRLSIGTIRREPHYGLPGIALMPRAMAKWWVTRWKKTSSTYELYRIPTYWGLRRRLHDEGFRIDETVPFREATEEMVGSRRLGRSIEWMRRLGLARLAVNKYTARMWLGFLRADIELLAYKN